MNRNSKIIFAIAATASAAGLSARTSCAATTAISIGASQYSGGPHGSNSEGFKFTVSSPLLVTALDFDLENSVRTDANGTYTHQPSGLTSDDVRLYTATTVGGTPVVTELASVDVTSSDPTTTTGGGLYPPGNPNSPVAPVITYSHHTITNPSTGLAAPVLLVPGLNYFVAGDIPFDASTVPGSNPPTSAAGNETYLIYANTSSVYGPANIFVASPVTYDYGVDNGIFSNQPFGADPTTGPTDQFGNPLSYGLGYNVNFDFTAVPAPEPASIGLGLSVFGLLAVRRRRSR